MSNTIVIYPGRFQPMGKHHFKTYKSACKKYGEENVYITTSNKIQEGRSPLSFKTKSDIMNLHGVPYEQIIETKNPYAPKELFQMLERTTGKQLSDFKLVVLVGEKDMKDNPRFNNVGMTKSTKRNPVPRPTYFQFLNENMETADVHGYLHVMPHVSYKLPNGKESSGTNIREFLSEASHSEFVECLGFYSDLLDFKKKDYHMLTEKFNNESKGSSKYSKDLESIIEDLKNIKKSFNSRKKTGQRYRKEASILQNAINTIKKMKNKNDLELERKKMLSENSIDYKKIKNYYSKFDK